MKIRSIINFHLKILLGNKLLLNFNGVMVGIKDKVQSNWQAVLVMLNTKEGWSIKEIGVQGKWNIRPYKEVIAKGVF